MRRWIGGDVVAFVGYPGCPRERKRKTTRRPGGSAKAPGVDDVRARRARRLTRTFLSHRPGRVWIDGCRLECDQKVVHGVCVRAPTLERSQRINKRKPVRLVSSPASAPGPARPSFPFIGSAIFASSGRRFPPPSLSISCEHDSPMSAGANRLQRAREHSQVTERADAQVRGRGRQERRGLQTRDCFRISSKSSAAAHSSRDAPQANFPTRLILLRMRDAQQQPRGSRPRLASHR